MTICATHKGLNSYLNKTTPNTTNALPVDQYVKRANVLTTSTRIFLLHFVHNFQHLLKISMHLLCNVSFVDIRDI